MPTHEVIERALELIDVDYVNYQYFFSKLNSADWLLPLSEKGYFSSPPSAEIDQEQEKIRFPEWPESAYLARVVSDAPDLVAKIIMKIPDTNNMRVHQDVARAVVQMPHHLAVAWAKKEIKWIQEQKYLYLSLPSILGQLVEHLSGSKVQKTREESLRLAGVLLATISDDSSFRLYGMHVSDREYAQLIEEIFPRVLENTKIEGLNLLCDLLEGIFTASNDEYNDYSWAWRPAIERHDQNDIGRNDVQNSLVDAIRDGALQLVEIGIELENIINLLLGRNKLIFKRIVIHMLEKYHRNSNAKAFVLDKANFYDRVHHHEYIRLLNIMFPSFDEYDKATILTWIEDGPRKNKRRENQNEEQDPIYLKSWQRNRLYGIRNSLPDKWKKYYDNLIVELGEPEHPDFLMYMTSGWGWESPRQSDELEEMSMEKIATFLKTWKPSGKLGAPEPEGLAHELQLLVKKKLTIFIENLSLFHDIDPIYARALIRNFSDVIKDGTKFEVSQWRELINFVVWISSQSHSIEINHTEGVVQTPHWSGVRKECVTLILAGLGRNSIPFSFRNTVWHIIENIIDDPDPSPEDDEMAISDPVTQSINTVRGYVLHAVIEYLQWISNIQSEKQEDYSVGIVSEVKECLEKHLIPSYEPSPSVRAVYGYHLLFLYSLDSSWVQQNITNIFPQKNPLLRNAAWNAYLVANEPPPDSLLSQFWGLYHDSVENLSMKDEGKEYKWFPQRPEERLGEHLMQMLGWDLIRWSSGDNLIKHFFLNASLEDARNAIDFVGRSFPSDMSQEMLDRFQKFWEELISYVLMEAGDRGPILTPFGDWFASGCFEDNWAFDQLEQVLKLSKEVWSEKVVVERMTKLDDEYLGRCLRILQNLILLDREPWHVLSWQDNAEVILRRGLANKETSSEARNIVNLLCRKGHLRFRDLLNDNSDEK